MLLESNIRKKWVFGLNNDIDMFQVLRQTIPYNELPIGLSFYPFLNRFQVSPRVALKQQPRVA